jgi:xylulokinase
VIYLGIDCGTQSTKTIALDADTGRIVASATQTYEILPGLPPGHLEQHPATWSQALDATMLQVSRALGERRGEVRGIGVSGQQHGFVALDKEGRVIRPAKLWCDTSTTEECDLIRSHLGGSKAVIEKVGMDMLPGFTAPKILWLKRHEPENFAKLATVLLPHDYLNFVLTGNRCMEYGDASGTALMDAPAHGQRTCWILSIPRSPIKCHYLVPRANPLARSYPISPKAGTSQTALSSALAVATT